MLPGMLWGWRASAERFCGRCVGLAVVFWRRTGRASVGYNGKDGRVSELADEPDSKSGVLHCTCGFKSHLGHQRDTDCDFCDENWAFLSQKIGLKLIESIRTWDSKSRALHWACGFDPHLRHHASCPPVASSCPGPQGDRAIAVSVPIGPTKKQIEMFSVYRW